jgi:hypothetical protein
MRHADIQTTGKFYVHTDDAQKEAAASALELAFAADLQSAFANLLPSCYPSKLTNCGGWI